MSLSLALVQAGQLARAATSTADRPKTDAEAIDAMSSAWGKPAERALEETDFITLQSQEEVRDAWKRFIHSHHYEVTDDFFDSWIAQHPRRTGEAYLAQ